MEKYSVKQPKKGKEKTSAKSGDPTCPVCGKKAEIHGSIYKCPQCGTEPWERSRIPKKRGQDT